MADTRTFTAPMLDGRSTAGVNDNDSEHETNSNAPGPPPSVVGSMISSNASALHSPTTQRSSSSLPQIRSRVTVVCAECKRLKLKCDRRIPCGSCQKRDTISRCIYSQAATEKVDVQTLHNRVTTIEGNLAAIPALIAKLTSVTSAESSQPVPSGSSSSSTAPGQSPSNRQPVSQDGYGTSTSGARMLAISPNGASAVVNLDGTAGLWISDLEAELGREGPRFDLRPVDKAAKFHNQSNNTPKETAAEILERHIGIGSFPSAVPPDTTTPAASTSSQSDPYHQLIGELLARFPSEAARDQMLRRFELMIQRRGAWCIPFSLFREQVAWLLSFASGDKGKGKAKCPSLNGEGAVDGKPSLSLLATVAAGLAMGALTWISEDAGGDPTLSGSISIPSPTGRDSGKSRCPGTDGAPARAFGVHAGTPHALYKLGRLAMSLHLERHGYAALDETYVLAQIMLAGYLMLAHREDRNSPSSPLGSGRSPNLPLSLPPELPALTADLCLTARLMGLNTDPDDFAMFGETAGPRSSGSGYGLNGKRVGASAGEEEEEREIKVEEDSGEPIGQWGRLSMYRKESRRRLWWEVAWLDMLVSDCLNVAPNFQNDECTTRIPSYIDDDRFDNDMRRTPLRDDEAQSLVNFFVMRCELTKLLKGVKRRAAINLYSESSSDPNDLSRNIHALAQEVTNWFENIDDVYKIKHLPRLGDIFSPHLPTSVPASPPMASLMSSTEGPMSSLPSSPPQDSPVANPELDILTNQRCELAAFAQHAILQLFLPLVRAMTPSSSDGSSGQRMHLDGLHAIDPALHNIRVCQLQHRVTKAKSALLVTFSGYSFNRMLFDAAVVLAHIAIHHSKFASSMVMDGIRAALAILKDTESSRAGPDVERPPSEQIRVLDALLEKANAAARTESSSASGMKRKFDEVDSGKADTFRQDFCLPFVGANVVNVNHSTRHRILVERSTSESHSDPAMHESSRVKLDVSGEVSWGAPPEVPASQRRNSQSSGRITVRSRPERPSTDGSRRRGESVSNHYAPHAHSQSSTSMVPEATVRPQPQPQPQPIVIPTSTPSPYHIQATSVPPQHPLSQAGSPTEFSSGPYINGGYAVSTNFGHQQRLPPQFGPHQPSSQQPQQQSPQRAAQPPYDSFPHAQPMYYSNGINPYPGNYQHYQQTQEDVQRHGVPGHGPPSEQISTTTQELRFRDLTMASSNESQAATSSPQVYQNTQIAPQAHLLQDGTWQQDPPLSWTNYHHNYFINNNEQS